MRRDDSAGAALHGSDRSQLAPRTDGIVYRRGELSGYGRMSISAAPNKASRLGLDDQPTKLAADEQLSTNEPVRPRRTTEISSIEN